MPSSISAAQRRETIGSLSAGLGGNEDSSYLLTNAGEVMADFGDQFKRNLSRIMTERNMIATGSLVSDYNFELSDDGTLLQLIMPDYFDFPNEGVKGWGDSSNAPNSPYQYKSKGMSEEGRASIKQYIQSGKAKIETVVKSRDKALGIGAERKGLSLLDSKTNTMVYLIKRFGIKTTNYFTDALNETFGGTDFELKMAEAVGEDIVFTLEKINR